LDISGHAKQQPVNQNDSFYGMFNGELFNFREFGDAEADTDLLVKLFSTKDMRQKVDGEYAVVLFDQGNGKLTVSSDTFLTKPMYWAVKPNHELAIASYASAIEALGFNEINMMQPNASLEFCLESVTLVGEGNTMEFDLNQYKTDYKDWIEAFVESVRLRALHGNISPFVAMSSGYDSGAIALALNLLSIPYHTYTITLGENQSVLKERFRLNKANKVIIDHIPTSERRKFAKMLEQDVERFTYQHEDTPGVKGAIHTDPSSVAICFIAEKARKSGHFVGLSGSGSDEIMSDYGMDGHKIYHHSEFAGIFPSSLEGFFPWKKFYGDSMRSYLFKDEMVLGHFGLEGRYPFLSRHVVQEFLSLSVELKNAAYKAPIKAFFEKYNYPFQEKVKLGFNPTEQNTTRKMVKKYLKNKMSWLGR
jgi:asparagine synthetase B (glutamine-hydrolysing)